MAAPVKNPQSQNARCPAKNIKTRTRRRPTQCRLRRSLPGPWHLHSAWDHGRVSARKQPPSSTEVNAEGSQDLSASSPDPAVLPQPAAPAALFVWDFPLPQDDLAAKLDLAKGPRDTSQALDATPELAFAARLLPTEPVTPADTTSFADEQSESQDSAVPGSAPSSSINPEPRSAGLVVGTGPKGGAPDHSAGERGEDPQAGQAGIESAWNTPSPADGENRPSAPAQAASQTSPTVVDPPEQAPQPGPRDVSLHLADGQGGVDIRMAERAGEIRVTVHTPDGDLANSLRADLPDLVGKLRQIGFQAEAWRPAAAPDAGRRSHSDGSPSQEHSFGGRRDGRQQQPQQQQPKNQSRWAGEWQSMLDPAQDSNI